jgi:hypothetical protein
MTDTGSQGAQCCLLCFLHSPFGSSTSRSIACQSLLFDSRQNIIRAELAQRKGQANEAAVLPGQLDKSSILSRSKPSAICRTSGTFG